MPQHEDFIKSIEGGERRYFTNKLEVREADGQQYFEGYSVRFNSPTDLGAFSEEIAPEAFSHLQDQDIRCLFNHDENRVLGRTTSGTCQVWTEADGQKYRSLYNPNDPDHVAAMEKVKRGDVDQSSFGFIAEEDEWTKRDGKPHRRITRMKAQFDVSPVTYPAYADTTVAQRSLNSLQSKDTEKRKAARDRKIKISKAKTQQLKLNSKSI